MNTGRQVTPAHASYNPGGLTVTTLLLTRPLPQSERFAAMVGETLPDLPVVISPILRIVPADTPELRDGEDVILTSANALGVIDPNLLTGRTAYCVGDRTAEAAKAAGMHAVSADGDADALVRLLQSIPVAEPLVHLRGRHSRGDVAGSLVRAGLDVREIVVYDQQPASLTPEARVLLNKTAPVILPLFSARSAALLSEAACDSRAALAVIAISKVAASAWNGPIPARLVVAARPKAEAILDEIGKICAEWSG